MLDVEINVIGWISEEWGEWLGGLVMSHPAPGQTLLAGALPDQAAVYGVIARMRDLGFQLSSLKVKASEKKDAGYAEQAR